MRVGSVIGVEAEFGEPKVTAVALDGPEESSCLQVEGGPGTFVVEGVAVDEHDGADGGVRLGALAREWRRSHRGRDHSTAETGGRIVSDGIPVWVDQNTGEWVGRGGAVC